ncbi:fatty acid desaturase [Roseibium sp. HPY-6]|uniref:fatty acid desaturase family protein n=1 Tax=Roseibium sp. HPY-6 TaxID=3229852 RepID=UPI00338FAF6A
MPNYQPKSAFSSRLNARAGRYLSRSKTGRFAGIGQWFRSSMLFLFCAAVYSLIYAGLNPWVLLISAVVLGAGIYTLIATVCHDAAHGSFATSKWVNAVCLFAGFSLIGVSGKLWAERHLRLHHMYPNIAGTDIDADGSSLLRLSPSKPWRKWHKFQCWYAVFLYALVLPHLAFVEDFDHLRKAKRAWPRKFSGLWPIVEFVASKIVHICLFLVLPLVLTEHGIGFLTCYYIAFVSSASLLFVAINVGSHISDAAEFFDPGSDGDLPLDWAHHQIRTAVDWAPTSRLAIALTGGANAHSAHHLFPRFAHSHNRALSRMVIRTAREFGVPLNILAPWDVLRAHVAHLYKMSRPPKILDEARAGSA